MRIVFIDMCVFYARKKCSFVTVKIRGSALAMICVVVILGYNLNYRDIFMLSVRDARSTFGKGLKK